MKIEKLNDNQIRCTLNKHDLIDRELKISELAYGSEKAKGLFRDMMNQAFDEFGFEADDIPLIIEAIPISGDCIILIVTKVEDPDELDTRFAKFSEAIEDMEDDDSDEDELELIGTADVEDEFRNAEDILNLIKRISEGLTGDDKNLQEHIVPISQRAKEALKKAQTAKTGQGLPVRIFSFNSLGEVDTLAAVIRDEFTGRSTLYKDARTKTYYLALLSDSENNESFTKVLNTISEFGRREKVTNATLAYFDEHYEVIIRDKAIEILASL